MNSPALHRLLGRGRPIWIMGAHEVGLIGYYNVGRLDEASLGDLNVVAGAVYKQHG